MSAPPARPLPKAARDRLQELAALGPNWDSYGAEPPSAAAYLVARDLIALVAERHDPADPRALPWFIAPLADGGVQAEWRGPGGAIEVEVDPDGRLGYLIERGVAGDIDYEEGDDLGIEIEDAAALVDRFQAGRLCQPDARGVGTLSVDIQEFQGS